MRGKEQGNNEVTLGTNSFSPNCMTMSIMIPAPSYSILN